MYAILTGRSKGGPLGVPPVAYFYQQHNSTPLFMYELTNPEDTRWRFALRFWNTTQSSIPLDFYPTLQSVDIDTGADTLSGNCTVPNSVTDPQTTTASCLSGSFDLAKTTQLTLNITASNPLNDSFGGIPPPSTTMLRTHNDIWAHGNEVPTLLLQEVDPASGELQEEVFRTNVANPKVCSQMKVCLSGGESGIPVSAEVLAPLGFIHVVMVVQAGGCSGVSWSDFIELDDIELPQIGSEGRGRGHES